MNVSETILKEADILLKAFVTGATLMLVYDLLRIARKLIPHGIFLISLEDLLFWMSSAVVIFAMLFREDDGYLRAFSIGGVVLGMALYGLTLSRYVVRGAVFVLEKILYLLLRPFVCLFRLLRRPAGAIKRRFRIFPRFCRKILQFCRKRLIKLWKAVKIGLCKQ